MSESKDSVSKLEHQTALMHYNWANRRMLIALICVCATFLLTILVFVFGYTVRERNWLDTIRDLRTPVNTEVQYGMEQDTDN